MQIPLTLLAGLSPTLRRPVLEATITPGTVAVVVEQDELSTRGVLTWEVRDRSGSIETGELNVEDCGACELVDSLRSLLETLADRGHWQHVVLAPPPALEPRLLVSAFPEAVDTVTCVVDAVLLVEHLSGDELLAERGLALGPLDRRNVAELTARQIEYADICVLANAHRCTSSILLADLVKHLNPRTTVLSAGLSGVPDEPVARTGRFDLDAAEAWAEELTGERLQPSGDGVTSVLWRSTRPLHPARLDDALEDIVAGVVRSRGVVWLANRPTQRVRWESAGFSASLGTLGEWSDTEHLAECCLIATGVGLDPHRLRSVLDACLLTDAELTSSAWQTLDDPFADVL